MQKALVKNWIEILELLQKALVKNWIEILELLFNFILAKTSFKFHLPPRTTNISSIPVEK